MGSSHFILFSSTYNFNENKLNVIKNSLYTHIFIFYVIYG